MKQAAKPDIHFDLWQQTLVQGNQRLGFGRDLMNPLFLVSILLFTAYWTWIFLIHWSSVLVPVRYDETFAMFFRGATLAGAATGFMALVLLKKTRGYIRFIGNPLVFAAAMSLVGLAALLESLGAPLDERLYLLLCFISGYGSSFLLVRVGYMLCWFKTDAAFPLLFISLLLSVLVCVFSQLASQVVAQIVMLALAWIAAALVTVVALTGLAAPSNSEDAPPEKNGKDSKEAADAAGTRQATQPATRPAAHPAGQLAGQTNTQAALRNGTTRTPGNHLLDQAQMFIFSTVFALTTCVGVILPGKTGATSYLWLAFSLAALLIILYSMWLNRYLTMDWLQIALMGFIALALIPLSLPMLPQAASTLLFLLLAFAFTSYDVLKLYLLSRTITLSRLTFLDFFARGRAANALGMLVGWASAWFGFVYLKDDLSLMFVILASTLCVLAMGATIVVLLNKKGTQDDYDNKEDDAEPKLFGKSAWRVACEEISERWNLSPREAEVYRYLVRGRDASYICEKLFISNHTAKSHIYHIYQKVGVHSQQELITLTEARAGNLHGQT